MIKWLVIDILQVIILKLECLKQSNISYRKNNKINEGIIDTSVKEPKVITLSTPYVDNISILYKQS